ncbi:glucan endo-1,3-beta-D-glucosidase-like [Capsicum annuum]|uniref:glucan endo-1,3-beta-D-glucosidase-like n=1 Tax=Capsicum annuum TaxID=4072 RepID=UPI001FB0EDF8|nr:glucan endo-1,3-beta-D-glucosidase-like [Capsicum annuum]
MEKLNVFSCSLVLLFFTSFCQGAKQGSWCVANWFVEDEQLWAYLVKKCKHKQVCKGNQPGMPCYDPNTNHSHASCILNNQYKKKRNREPCPEDIGMIVHMNPSYGDCFYR